jgi:hypothetical protein
VEKFIEPIYNRDVRDKGDFAPCDCSLRGSIFLLGINSQGGKGKCMI